MIRVRATQDGTYAGHYWQGPVTTDQGYKPGDVFDVENKLYIVKDEHGNPVQEFEPTGQVDDKGNKTYRKAWLMDANGKMKKDANGQPIPKIKMASYFSKTWMEEVPPTTELTYPDREPYRLPEPYRVKRQPGQPQKTVALPTELPAPTESVI